MKLSAYLVIKKGIPAPTAADLRQLVRSQLPEAMVPSGFWQIQQIPMLPSGKVNRAGLATIPATALSDKELVIAPRNQTEVKLADTWRELLQIEKIGIEENFFELGGHSLLVLQLTARIRRVFDVELPVRTAFEVPTIAGLAAEIEKAQALGLKARTPIPHRGSTFPERTTHEALVSQLEKLTADDAGNLLRDLLDQKKYQTPR